MQNVFDFLKKRGYVFQVSDEGKVRELLGSRGATVYCGFDPSADSLHLGHLLIIMAMHYLQEAGHRIIYLIGGGTGLVGDPTGKTQARKRLSPEIIAENAEKIKGQVENMGLLRFEGNNPALMLNNLHWLGKFSFLGDFIMEIGPGFSVNRMVKMETFTQRLTQGEHLSLLEFLYPVMQAWDFLWLFENYHCRLQVGGSDQWGNILEGIELVKRKHQQEVFALTFPLLVDPSTEAKMGKTEKGPVWLDPEKTSPFEFFQYLQKTSDELVPQMLRLFTFLHLEEIADIIKNHRDAQLRLAFEITKIVHGVAEANKTRNDVGQLAQGLKKETLAIPVFEIPKEGLPLEEVLTLSCMLPSRNEVRRRCRGGAMWVNDEKTLDPKTSIKKECVIRYGKGRFLKVVERERL